MILIKKEIKINSRKSLALYKEHLQRKREDTRADAREQIRDMAGYWTLSRIVRELTRTSYVPLLAEGLIGAAMAYATRSYTNPTFIKSAFTGVAGLFRRNKHENKHELEDDTPHTDL